MKLLIDARAVGTRPSGVGIYGYRYIGALLAATDWEIVLVSDVAQSDELRRLCGQGTGDASGSADGSDAVLESAGGSDAVSAGNRAGQADRRIARLVLLGKSISKTAGVFTYFRFVQKVIEDEKPDIFWEINNIFPIRLRNPYGHIVVTLHDIFPLTMPECYSRTYPYYFRLGLRQICKAADGIIYDAETIRSEAQERWSGLGNIRSIVGYVPVSASTAGGERRTDLAEQTEAQRAARVSEDGETPRGSSASEEGNAGYLLYIGNLERRKGSDILIEAYRSYRAAGGGMELHIAGKLREREIRELVDAAVNDIPGFVYLGYISDEEREAEFAGCDAFVFPSRAEGFGIPVIEALGCGKPVIASDLPIFGEIAAGAVQTFELHGRDDPAGQLAAAMADIAPQDDVKAREIAGRYSADALAPRITEFLEDMARL